MAKQAQCPVCGAELGDKIPDFCPTCGWECGVDITLFPMLNLPTEHEREHYRAKLARAREKWKLIHSLGEDNEALAAELQKANAEISRITKKIDKLSKTKNTVESLQNKLGIANGENKKLQEEISTLREELRNGQDKIGQLQSELNGINSENKNLQNNIKALQSSLNEAYARAESYLRQLPQRQKHKRRKSVFGSIVAIFGKLVSKLWQEGLSHILVLLMILLYIFIWM